MKNNFLLSKPSITKNDSKIRKISQISLIKTNPITTNPSSKNQSNLVMKYKETSEFLKMRDKQLLDNFNKKNKMFPSKNFIHKQSHDTKLSLNKHSTSQSILKNNNETNIIDSTRSFVNNYLNNKSNFLKKINTINSSYFTINKDVSSVEGTKEAVKLNRTKSSRINLKKPDLKKEVESYIAKQSVKKRGHSEANISIRKEKFLKNCKSLENIEKIYKGSKKPSLILKKSEIKLNNESKEKTKILLGKLKVNTKEINHIFKKDKIIKTTTKNVKNFKTIENVDSKDNKIQNILTKELIKPTLKREKSFANIKETKKDFDLKNLKITLKRQKVLSTIPSNIIIKPNNYRNLDEIIKYNKQEETISNPNDSFDTSTENVKQLQTQVNEDLFKIIKILNFENFDENIFDDNCKEYLQFKANFKDINSFFESKKKLNSMFHKTISTLATTEKKSVYTQRKDEPPIVYPQKINLFQSFFK